jgi:hypothetical protein
MRGATFSGPGPDEAIWRAARQAALRSLHQALALPLSVLLFALCATGPEAERKNPDLNLKTLSDALAADLSVYAHGAPAHLRVV